MKRSDSSCRRLLGQSNGGGTDDCFPEDHTKCWRDVTEGDGVNAFLEAAEARFGRVDVLVNNTGAMPLPPLVALRKDEWKRVVDVFIHRVSVGIAAVLPRFLAQKSDYIVNVASVAAHMVMPTAAVCCSTKHAERAITEG